MNQELFYLSVWSKKFPEEVSEIIVCIDGAMLINTIMDIEEKCPNEFGMAIAVGE